MSQVERGARGFTAMRILLVVSVLSVAGVAHADAISGPPACPPGTAGRSSHSGQWCEAATCTTDADCANAGGSCREWRVCTRVSAIMPGGHRAGPVSPIDTVIAIGSCAPQAACDGTEEPPPETAGTLAAGAPSCTTGRFCVRELLPSLPTLPTALTPRPGTTAPPTTPAPRTTTPAAAAGGHGCGCSVPAGGAGGVALVALGAVALVVARRRR